MAKPWATSHVSTVAAGLGIDHRISGDVKERLVELLKEHLKDVTRDMEDATLAADPGRKTLDDPTRTRLGFSRTRGMMIENLGKVDSVGAAAVVAVNEQLEAYLRTLLGSASNIASVERMNTIKSRHLQQALEAMGHAGPSDEAVEAFTPAEAQRDAVGDALDSSTGGALTPLVLRQMAKSFAKGKRVDDEAIEELILLFYDHVGEVQHEMKTGLLGGDPAAFIQKLHRMESLFMLGWMRNMLTAACDAADSANSRIVLVDHIVNLDPWM
jgi:histone H3/H4